MLRRTPVSLNQMSYDSVIRALKLMRSPPHCNNNHHPDKHDQPVNFTIDTIFVDTVGDPDYYQRRLWEGVGREFAEEIVVEKKADAKFKVVSAASIIAKVTRDTILQHWQWRETQGRWDTGFGSGYPGDEVCVQW
jgi:ribonuclease HII